MNFKFSSLDIKLRINLLKIWFLIIFIFPILGFIVIKYFGGHIQESGQLGDTFGGIMGPFIAMIAAFLTYIAFYIQYEANQQQKLDLQIERFESKFFELVNLHKSNVEHMEIANEIKGRKVFMRMYYELKYIYLIYFETSKKYKKKFSFNYTQKELCNLAYKTFFFGIDSNAENDYKMYNERDLPLYVLVKMGLVNTQSKYTKKRKKNIDAIFVTNNEMDSSIYSFECFYFPFDGHSSRLGHYYRHLFQLVKYVTEINIYKFDRLKKYEYTKIIRSQLSNHEQLLLYYNALSSFGDEWLKKDFFTDYRMIKNIPINLADFGVKPHDLLGEINKFKELLFEYDED
jgi:hypothetical protein